MTWRVTHVDHAHRRRQVELECKGRSAAEALVLLMYGAALYLAAVKRRGAQSQPCNGACQRYGQCRCDAPVATNQPGVR